MSHGNPFIWSQKVKGQGNEAQKQCRREFLHSCKRWLLLVTAYYSITVSHFMRCGS